MKNCPLPAHILFLMSLVFGLAACGGDGGGGSPAVGESDPDTSVVLDHTNYNVFIADDGQNGAELWHTNGLEADTRLLKELNTIGHSAATGFTQVGSNIYFRADDGINGVELWKYDGTSVSLVKDINPDGNSNPIGFVDFNGSVLFKAYGEASNELYLSDGTTAGTKLVAGSANGYSGVALRSSEALNGEVYFTATHTVDGPGVWKTDGVSYTKVLDGLAVWGVHYNNKAYFMIYDAADVTKAALWEYDGTTANSLQQFTSTSIKSYINYILNSKLYFIMNEAVAGGALWSYDGTTVSRVKVLNPTGSTVAYYSLEAQGKFYFMGRDDTYGDEPWVTDGTSLGTHMVKDVNPAGDTNFIHQVAAGTTVYLSQWNTSYSGTSVLAINTADDATVTTTTFEVISKAINFNGFDYFTAFDPAVGVSLYRQSGAVPELVKTVELLTQVNYLWPGSQLFVVNGKLIFANYDSTNGKELWESDGTTVGTRLLTDLRPGSESGVASSSIYQIGNELFFIGNNGTTGDEFWKTDGTAAGTGLVADINTSTSAGINNYETFEFKGKTYFFGADDRVTRHNLYATDGTADGTVKIVNTGDYNPHRFVLADKLLFESYVPDSGIDIVVSDGTVGNAQPVIDMDPTGSYNLRSYYGYSSQMACIKDGDGAIWRMDGTVDGTYKYTINNLADFSSIYRYMPVGSDLMALATDSATGVRNLYRHQTDQLLPLLPNQLVSTSTNIMNEILYFTSSDASGTGELWRSDGTVAGTNVVISTVNSSIYLVGDYDAKAKDWLMYYISDDVSDTFWRFDGTAHQKVTGGEDIARIYDFVQVGDYMYLSVESLTPTLNGWEIWRVDASGQASMMIDIQSASSSKPISQMKQLNNGFTFIAEDTLHGREMWISNGSASGTYILKDINPGVADSTRN